MNPFLVPAIHGLRSASDGRFSLPGRVVAPLGIAPVLQGHCCGHLPVELEVRLQEGGCGVSTFHLGAFRSEVPVRGLGTGRPPRAAGGRPPLR